MRVRECERVVSERVLERRMRIAFSLLRAVTRYMLGISLERLLYLEGRKKGGEAEPPFFAIRSGGDGGSVSQGFEFAEGGE